jgi:eukaryotic-like serine/threonine-protein kinase
MGNARISAASSYRTVGRYRVYSELASGGMATVHLGCLLGPAGFSKLVAVKCLHEQFALEPEFVSMFLDEARLASTIHHPNVVASLDVVAEQGELLVVMEYVHGETLAGLLRLARHTGDSAPVPVVVRALCDALEGLHAAHIASLAGRSLNIVHRDVSPQNIMVGADGNTRVLDFGIAQAALRSQMTAAGTVKGKVAYMSPEQVQGLSVDARTDVFAAGVVLWEALVGRRLFFAPDSRDAVKLLLSSPIPAPSSLVPSLSPALDQVVFKALARDVDARFATAHEFAEALRDAAHEGSRREVAEWVNRVAKDGLAKRLEQLQALEASAIHTQVAVPLPVVTASSPQHAAPNPDGTQATTSTSILPHPPPAKRRRAAPWIFAAAGVLAALAVWATRPDEVSSPPASAAVRAPAVQPPSSPQLPVRPAQVEAVSPLPPLEVAPPAPEPSPAATVASKPIAKKQGGVVSQSAGSRAKQCNPPYRIDASGVRRVKPECL